MKTLPLSHVCQHAASGYAACKRHAFRSVRHIFVMRLWVSYRTRKTMMAQGRSTPH